MRQDNIWPHLPSIFYTVILYPVLRNTTHTHKSILKRKLPQNSMHFFNLIEGCLSVRLQPSLQSNSVSSTLKGESSNQACRSYIIVNMIVKDRKFFFSFYDSSKCRRLTRSICTRLNYTTSQRHYIRLCCIYIQPYSLNYTTTQTFPYSCVLCINRLYGSA